MPNRCFLRLTLALLFLAFCGADPRAAVAQAIDRVQWTSSRIHGTPDPPPPFAVESIFQDVQLQLPTEMVLVPGTDRWIVTENGGKVFSFSKSLPRDEFVAIDLKSLPSGCDQVYGLTFHPQYPAEPWCYLCYAAGGGPDGTRLSRFKVVDTGRPVLAPESETLLLSWQGGGHSGGSLHFGSEGYLYFSTGDGAGPNPPDPADTGQDISDLEASVLRIDVDHRDDGLSYRIPPDNPFVGHPNARGEIWAFGFRNPWKMAFDPKTDTLWTGDVGWEMQEMIYKVDRGANYGWSLMEGSQVVKENGILGPAPITPPMVEHSHLEARSITGGYFWNSSRLPELENVYLYGDWITGKIWGLKHDGQEITWQQELADTTMRIVCFAVDDDGEVLVVGYDGSIHRLVPNSAAAAQTDFPRRLSETGLFESTADQAAAPGVVPYEINAHHWSDHTRSHQWVAIPGQSQIRLFDQADWRTGQIVGHFSFPHDSVLAKTVFYHPDDSDRSRAVRLETQILHRNGDDWNAYNYIWNDDQTDAILQDNVASDREITIADGREPSGIRVQNWHHASRDECLQCHFWNASTVHGFKISQLMRDDPFGSGSQLDRIAASGILESGLLDHSLAQVPPTVSPDDESASLEERVRSYLHMNCAHCHRNGGGGTATFELVQSIPLEKMGVVDALPTQGTFELPDARVIAPGDPYRSVLFYRFIKSGRGRMPQFGPSLIDDRGANLIHDWICSLEPDSESRIASQALQRVSNFKVPLSVVQCESVQNMLTSKVDALRLAYACADKAVSNDVRLAVADIASKHADSTVRDLFERFLPEERRVKRLGNNVNPATLLAITGRADEGRELYFSAPDVSCRQCHSIGDQGENVGPDLSSIGLQRTAEEILQSVLQPSAKIDDKYRGRVVLTADGTVISGLVLREDSEGITVVDGSGNKRVIPKDEIDSMKEMEKSVMPDRLLDEFTAQQAADLLAFLKSQTKPLALQGNLPTADRPTP